MPVSRKRKTRKRGKGAPPKPMQPISDARALRIQNMLNTYATLDEVEQAMLREQQKKEDAHDG